MPPCKRCNGTSFNREESSGNSYCNGCGTLEEYDNYAEQLRGINGPEGTYIRAGYSGTGSVLSYKDKKIYEANNLIKDIIGEVNMSAYYESIKSMISKLTDGEFGQGEWFPILIGACCYAFVRKEEKGVLSMEEIAIVVGCELHQLGSMVKRVVKHLELELKEFDLVGLFVKTASNSPRLSYVDSKKKERIIEQGSFLMNCSLKWFLSTGRKPMPLVLAVLAFVSQVNGVKVKIDDLAEDVRVPVTTCKTRYRELAKKLVEVAEEIGLPWAKDVTVKNVLKHSVTLIGLMEAKSMRKRSKEARSGGFCLEEIVKDCLSKEAMYCSDDGVRGKSSMWQRKSGFEMVSCEDWWKGESKLSQKLKLKEVLEKDVGLDVMPPSYIKGCVAVERRREKIKEAKLRINAIQHPCDVVSEVVSLELEEHSKKKRKRESEIDWEDLVIQTLVLHNVKDEEIEKGHYKALLGLHVFNS